MPKLRIEESVTAVSPGKDSIRNMQIEDCNVNARTLTTKKKHLLLLLNQDAVINQ